MSDGVKSWLGAALSLALGVLLGFGAFSVLQIGSVGRNLLAILLPTVPVLFIAGLVYGRTLVRGFATCLGGVATYALLVAAVVMSFAGGVPDDGIGWRYVLEWDVLVLLATVPPWFLGTLVGMWSRRFQLTR